MLESKETNPHITTKEELDALYKNVLQNKESIGEDPDKIAQKILSIYDATAALESKTYTFKKKDEKGKREYAVSLGQQQETYKTIEIVYNKTTGYVITIQQNGWTTIKINRYEERGEDIFILKKEEWAEHFSIKSQSEDNDKKTEAETVIEDIYAYTLSPASIQE